MRRLPPRPPSAFYWTPRRPSSRPARPIGLVRASSMSSSRAPGRSRGSREEHRASVEFLVAPGHLVKASQSPRNRSRFAVVGNALPKRRPKIAISGASSAPPTRSRRLATTRRPPWQCLSSSSPRKPSSMPSNLTPEPPCAWSATRASATRCGRVPMMYYLTRGARVHVLARPRTLVRVAGGVV